MWVVHEHAEEMLAMNLMEGSCVETECCNDRAFENKPTQHRAADIGRHQIRWYMHE